MSDPADPPLATDHVRAQADAFIDSLESAGAPIGRAALDYTPGSLAALDDLLGEFHTYGAEAPDDVILGAGSYLMEVGRTQHGGVYQAFNDEDPLVLVVQHEKGQVGMLATSKVKGRVINGSEDNLPFFYAGFEQAVRERLSATIC